MGDPRKHKNGLLIMPGAKGADQGQDARRELEVSWR